MFYHFKRCHSLLNGLALLLMAVSVAVATVCENSFVVVGLTALKTVVKGWNDFQKFSLKVNMCRFAYTAYEKTLIKFKTYNRGLPLDDFDGFLIKMQTLDDTITDFTPLMSDHCAREYSKHFYHTPVDTPSPQREHKLQVRDV